MSDRIFGFRLLALIACVTGACLAEAANLLTNGDFENGNSTGWSTSWFPVESGSLATQTASCSGTYGLWTYTASAYTEWAYSSVYQDKSSSPGKSFSASGEIKTPPSGVSVDWVSGSYACLRIAFLNSSKAELASYDSVHLTSGTTACGPFNLTTSAAPANTAYVRFTCYLYEPAEVAGRQSVVCFDSCSLEELPPPTPTATPTNTMPPTSTPTPVSGWSLATSDRPVCGSLIYGDKDPSAKDMAGLPALLTPSTRNVLPHFASDASRWYTGVGMANPNSVQAAVSIMAYDGSGTLKGSKDVTLPSKGKISQLVSSLFAGTVTGTGWLDVTSDSPIVAFDLYGDKISGGIAALPSPPLENAPILAHFIHSSRWWTGVVVMNPSSGETQITLKAYKADGTKIDEQTFPLPGGSKKSGTVESLMPGTSNQSGWISVESSQENVAALLVYGDKQITPNRIAAVNGASASTTFVLSSFMSDQDWWTGIALVNPSDTATATVALKAYASNGTLIDDANQVIGPLGKYLGLLDSIFDLNGQTLGWVKGASDLPIVGLEVISGDDANRSAWGLAGIESQSAGTTLYFPHMAVNGRWWTRFAAANPDDVNAANVTLDAFEDDADSMKHVTKNLPHNGMVADFVQILLGL